MTGGQHKNNCSFWDSKEAARIEKAINMRRELFDLANSFAGDELGEVAIYLHEACNNILRAEKALHQLTAT
jgi:hypothetical protein